MVVAPEKKVWTDEEFIALPDDGNKYELVNGELVVGNSGAKHGYIAVILSSALFHIVRSQKLGVILDSSTAFNMKTGNKRSPDISFVSKDRLQGVQELPNCFLEGAPDLVVEVLSPNNTVEEIHNKIVEYFENSAKLVWVVNPQEKYVLVYRSIEPNRLLKSSDNLDGEDVVPGFTFPVAELFQKLEF